MTHEDDADLRAALAEVAALRAALEAHGLGPDPADDLPGGAGAPDAAAVEAEIARIVAVPRDGAPDEPGAAPAPPSATPPAADPAAAAAAPVAAPVVALRGRRRAWWTAAAGVAAAAAVAVAVVVLPQGTPPAVASGAPPMLAYPVDPAALAAGGGAPAREVLLDLAATADARPDPAAAGRVQRTLAQGWYATTTDGADGAETTIEPTVTETWLRPDGSAVAAEWRGEPLGADGLLPRVDTSPEAATVDRLPAGTFDADAAAGLSTDPATLRAQLLAPLAGVGCTPDAPPATAAWCLYLAVTDLGDRSVVPAAVDAAVWRLLAEEPGVTLAGEVTDRAGRTAEAIAVAGGPPGSDPVVRVLLVDRATGRLSGREEVTLSSAALDVTEPTVTLFRYTVASDRVAEVGPAGDDGTARGPAAGPAQAWSSTSSAGTWSASSRAR